MDKWLRSFHQALLKDGLLRGVRRLLVGVSGGPDSVALLRLFWELKKESPDFPQLFAGHVHHGLRGEEADEDARFVRELAAGCEAEFLLARGDARAEARRRGLSPEAAARWLRFEAFGRWAAEKSVEAVALAHHLDDQAETVLLRAVRGSGPRGLAGMAPSRPLFPATGLAGRAFPADGGSPQVIRPLLAWRRSEILCYLAERGQAHRVDSSNCEASIPRNKVRHVILPLLEDEVQPGAVLSLARLGAMAAETARDLRQLGARALEAALDREPLGKCAGHAPASFSLALEPLAAWPRSVVREALILAFERALAASETAGMEGDEPVAPAEPPADKAAAVLGWLDDGGPSEARLDLKEGITVELRYGRLWLGRKATAGESAPGEPAPGDAVLLRRDPQPVVWRDWEFQIEEAGRTGVEKAAAAPDVLEEQVDAERVAASGPLHLRSRREGDRLQPLGAPGVKKLKEFFRERRVLPRDRNRVPLVVAGEEIVWVVGHRIAHPFRIRPETERVLILRARMNR